MQAIRDKVSLPGIFLIVVGVLNILAAAGEVWLGIWIRQVPDAEIERFLAEAEKNSPDAVKQLRDKIKEIGSLEQAKEAVAKQEFIYAAGHVVLALLTIFGGASMIRLRAYGLAVTGAIISAIPCISPMGCCLIGEVVGIWALVVLFNTDVNAAFKAKAGAPPPDEGMLR
jgi:hypothetical protein